ncbi:hypothetical protein B566_EDAN013685 [Ephemera danica]|nr:hypothetical protein B566_EDAN013685 [Ephemera danica]
MAEFDSYQPTTDSAAIYNKNSMNTKKYEILMQNSVSNCPAEDFEQVDAISALQFSQLRGTNNVASTQPKLVDENIIDGDNNVSNSHHPQSRQKLSSREPRKEHKKLGPPPKKAVFSTSNEQVKNNDLLSVYKKSYTAPLTTHRKRNQDNTQTSDIDFSNLLLQNLPIEQQNAPTKTDVPRRNSNMSTSFSENKRKAQENVTVAAPVKRMKPAPNTAGINVATTTSSRNSGVNSKVTTQRSSKVDKSNQPEFIEPNEHMMSATHIFEIKKWLML